MKAFLTISYFHPNQEIPNIVLWIRNRNYIFNMPPMYQRVFKGKGINFKSTSLIFVTNLTSSNINGFLGYISSMSAKHFNFQTKIYGPKNMSEFLFRRRFYLGVHSFKYSSYDFASKIPENTKSSLLGIKEVEELIKLNSKYNLKEILTNFESMKVLDKSKINDASFYINENPKEFSDGNATFIPVFFTDSESKTAKETIGYICRFKQNEYFPKIKNSDMKRYGLTYEDVKNIVLNKVITLKNGEKLNLSQIAPSFKMDEWTFIIIDCPSIAIMNQIIKNQSLIQCNDDNLAPLRSIIHIVPLSILENEHYQSWIKKFEKDCVHLFCCVESQQSNYYQKMVEFRQKLPCLQLYSALHRYFPEHFPSFKSTSRFQEIETKISKIKSLIPNGIFIDHQNFYEIQQNGILNKANLRNPVGNFSFQADQNFIQKYQNYQAAKSRYKPLQNENEFDPEILFLGTNSSQPTNFRNVSAVFMKIKDFRMMIDCGEGTYFQLFSHFGFEKIEEVLINLKIIYVSHFHSDHCMGIFEILVERNKIFKKIGKNPENNKIFLVVPSNLLPLIEDFNGLIQEIKDGVCYVLSSELSFSKKQTENYKPLPLSKSSLSSEELTVDEFLLQSKLTTVLTAFSESCAQNLKLLKQFLESYNISFQTIKTPHCQDSYALIVKHKNGRKFVYSGDTKYCEDLVQEGKNATILIHEATFFEKNNFHSSMSEAIRAGRNMNAWRTVLTHFTKDTYNLNPKEVIKSCISGKEKDEGLEKYAEESVVLAVDHLNAKLSEFEYLPEINKCLSIICPIDEF